jgi:opacity protein-like surface antigen
MMKTLAGILFATCTTLNAYAGTPDDRASAVEPTVSPSEDSSSEGSSRIRPERPERHVVLMPTVGVWTHTFKQSGYDARLGPVYGFDVKIDPFRWLNVRGGVLQGKQPISLPAHALGDDFSSYQPTIKFMRMHMRFEPVWHWSERTSAYVGLGLGWARLTAPAPVTTPSVASFERSGVYVAYEGALGVAYEPILDWLSIDVSAGVSYLTSENGSAFRSGQAFTEDGHRTTLESLSKLDLGYRMSLGIGIVL